MKRTNQLALLAAASSVMGTLPAGAANSFYAPGDLVLYFQKRDEPQTNTNTVYASLGNAATLFRGAAAGPDAAPMINIVDLSTTLTNAFGSGWASDPNIYAGLAGVWGSSSTELNLQDGDPQRTLYVSSPRTSVGTVGTADSSGYDLYFAGGGAMTSAASAIESQNNILENQYTTAVTISPAAVSGIDDANANPFVVVGSDVYQDTAFGGVFGGGVQQKGSATAFGTFPPYGSTPVGQAEFALDLYRILARTTIEGQVAGPLRVGTYEGTVLVGTNGQVSFMGIPEPGSIGLSGLALSLGLLRRRRQPA
jgi:hypothetical protein